MLDRSQPGDDHTAGRLVREPVAWLGSTRPDGRPHHVPVWFLWDDPTVWVFAPGTTQKVKNVRAHPAVTLTLDSADGGNDIVMLEGRAEVVADPAVRASTIPGFADKYGGLIAFPTMDDWSDVFHQPIRITTTRIVAWSKTPDGAMDYRVSS